MVNKGVVQITIDETVKNKVSLKDLCLRSKKELDALAVNFKIELLPNVEISLIDDLIEFNDLIGAQIINHSIEFVLNESSKIEFYSVLRSDSDDRNDVKSCCQFNKTLKFNFVGKDSYAKIRIRYMALDKQKINVFTEQNHLVSGSLSCFCFKSVLLDSSSLECKNKIFVDKALQDVFAKQINKNLLIGSTANIFTTPQLEVLSDKVKCRHGATVQTFDSEQLFYMQFRGITQKEAENHLIHGFLR